MTTLIRADRLIDGTGARPIEDAVLVIDGDRVAGVFAGKPPDGFVQGEVEETTFRGCTILPGLIDAHVHLNLPGDGTTLEVAVRETDGTLVATSAFAASRALAAGITTVRDVGCARNTVFDVRRALELGHGHGARVIAGGQPITITGGHTWYLGGEADGEAALRTKTRAMAKAGADFIKVMASGGGTVGTTSWLPAYSQAELNALAEEAHALGRRVTAHCLCAESTARVVDAGFDGIEHAGFLVDRDGTQEFVPAIAEKVARAGIPVTSTLAVGGYMLKHLRALTSPSAAERVILERWLRMFDDNLEQFRRMREAGVKWVAGTDAGWRYTPIEGLPMELALMQQGGMTALEAIAAGTGFAARVCGVADHVGTLAAGMIADVVVVQGNPLDDLTRLGDVRLVMQGGAARG